MPVIEITSYRIDFSVLDDNNPDTIIILDKSTYLDTPQKPLIDITLPGFTGYIEVPYNYGKLSLYNSDSLSITTPTDDGSLAPLPDGVYQITMKICPYDNSNFNTSRCYLKTSQFNAAYEAVLLSYPWSNSCYDSKDISQQMVDTDLLLQSAKAEANRCNVDRASQKYQAAVKKLTFINMQLNCS